MKLRNKKTGEIAELGYIASSDGYIILQELKTEEFIAKYDSLSELNEEWEDYEEPKTEFYITAWGDIREYTTEEERFAFKQKLGIGNYFSSREEAERAVEKLKAWKRLKDTGFKFTGFEETDRGCLGDFTIYCYIKPDYTRSYDDVKDDLELLFSQEDD